VTPQRREKGYRHFARIAGWRRGRAPSPRIPDKIEVSVLTKRQICESLKPDRLLSTRREHIPTIVAHLNKAVRLASGESALSLSERQPADTIEAWSES
jgi:hypothetical protein